MEATATSSDSSTTSSGHSSPLYSATSSNLSSRDSRTETPDTPLSSICDEIPVYISWSSDKTSAAIDDFFIMIEILRMARFTDSVMSHWTQKVRYSIPSLRIYSNAYVDAVKSGETMCGLACTRAEQDQPSLQCRATLESPAATDGIEVLDLTGDDDTASHAANSQITEFGNTHLAQWGIVEEEYEVEGIIGHEVIHGTPHYRVYRVKWRGWQSSANTWEPFENLGRCEDLIEEFYQPCRRRAR